MGFLSGLFHSRDKPTNSTNGSAYRFLFGGSNSDKAVNERSAMQMTAVYACVRILSEVDQYMAPVHHEAIISHSDFDAANALVNQRAAEKGLWRMWRHLQAQDTLLHHIQVCRLDLQHALEE